MTLINFAKGGPMSLQTGRFGGQPLLASPLYPFPARGFRRGEARSVSAGLQFGRECACLDGRTFRASGWVEMAWHLYKWGGAVEVLEPPELREMVAAWQNDSIEVLP